MRTYLFILLLIGVLAFVNACGNGEKTETADTDPNPDPVVTVTNVNEALVETTWCTLPCDANDDDKTGCDAVDSIVAVYFDADGNMQMQKHMANADGTIDVNPTRVDFGTWNLDEDNTLSLIRNLKYFEGPIEITTDKIGEKRLFFYDPNNTANRTGEWKECFAPRVEAVIQGKAEQAPTEELGPDGTPYADEDYEPKLSL